MADGVSLAMPESTIEVNSEGYSLEIATSTEIVPTRRIIVTDSLTEQILTASLLLFIWLFIASTNSAMIYVIWKVPKFHTPQYMVLVSYMICDVTFMTFGIPTMFFTVVGDSVDFVPSFVCGAFIVISSSCFFTQTLLIGFITYERYVNFFYPLTYNSYFTLKKIIICNLILHACGLGCSIMIESVTERKMVATALQCQPIGPAIKWNSPFVFFVYQVPSALFGIFTMIRLRLLITKHKSQVDAMPTEKKDVNQQDNKPKTQVFSVRKAIKIIALVSGSFWITTLPSTLIRVGLFSTGFTWDQSDTRESILLFALARGSYIMLICLSSLLNPCVYLYVQTDLRKALARCGRQ